MVHFMLYESHPSLFLNYPWGPKAVVELFTERWPMVLGSA